MRAAKPRRTRSILLGRETPVATLICDLIHCSFDFITLNIYRRLLLIKLGGGQQTEAPVVAHHDSKSRRRSCTRKRSHSLQQELRTRAALELRPFLLLAWVPCSSASPCHREVQEDQGELKHPGWVCCFTFPQSGPSQTHRLALRHYYIPRGSENQDCTLKKVMS
jgi:hypothetical protein